MISPYTDRPIPSYKLPALVAACRTFHIPYLLGGKCVPLGRLIPPDSGIDCSGFVRWAVFHATSVFAGPGYPLTLPDGSWAQKEWAGANLKPCGILDGLKNDGIIRIAYLPPMGGKEAHIMLVQNGWTVESHGGVGPDRRAWLSSGFMRLCNVWEFGVVI